MEQNEHMDEQLKRLLESLEAQPDLQSFDAIVQKMNRKKKRRRFGFFLLAGIGLLTGGFALFLNLEQERSQRVMTMEQKQPDNTARAHVNKQQTTLQTAVPHRQPDQDRSFSSAAATSSAVESHSQEHTETLLQNNSPGAEPGQSQKTFSSTEHHAASVPQKNKTFAGPLLKQESQATVSQTGAQQAPEPQPATDQTNAQQSPAPDAVAQATQLSIGQNPAGADQSGITTDSVQVQQPVWLLPVHMRLLPDTTAPEPIGLKEILELPERNTIKKKKNIHLYLGITGSPQYSSYHLLENAKRSNIYNTGNTLLSSPFSSQYLYGRKNQEKFRFSYAYGLKLGLQLNDYDVELGFGLQSYAYTEKLYVYAPAGPQPTAIYNPNISYNVPPDPNAGQRSGFAYYYYALEGGRLLSLNKWTKCRLQLGARMEELRYANYIGVVEANKYNILRATPQNKGYLSERLFTFRIKTIFSQNLGKRAELRCGPVFFYSASSMFKKDYVIRQRPYGGELELSLMFRLF